MKSNMLRAQMTLHGDTQEELARAVGIGRWALNGRLTGKTQFLANEIQAIITRYELTPEETKQIFFEE